MPPLIVIWDGTLSGYSVNVTLTPDDGIAITGLLQISQSGKPVVSKQLSFSDLVPRWEHVLGIAETMVLTLVFDYHTAATSKVVVNATCSDPEGNVHQQPLTGSYEGQRVHQTHLFISAKP